MTQMSGKIKIYVASSLILSIICSLLFSAAYLFSFEPYIGYFKTSALLPRIAASITILTVLWFFSSLFIIPNKSIDAGEVPYSKMTKIIAGICSAGFAAYFICRLVKMNIMTFSQFTIASSCSLLGILSVIYFIMTALNKKSGSGHIIAGFIPIFWAAVSMTEVYINKNIAMNNPLKISFMMTMMSFMLFMVYELRFLLGRGMPKLFMVFSLTGVLVSSVFEIPFLILTITGIYKIPDIFYSLFASIPFAVYILSRLIDFTRFHNVTT